MTNESDKFLSFSNNPHCKLLKGKELKRTLMWTNALLNETNGLILINNIDKFLLT